MPPTGGAPTETTACAAGDGPVQMQLFFSNTADEWLSGCSFDVWVYQEGGRRATDHGLEIRQLNHIMELKKILSS
jgi:hypothetical protein